jgi:hypothetical protein
MKRGVSDGLPHPHGGRGRRVGWTTTTTRRSGPQQSAQQPRKEDRGAKRARAFLVWLTLCLFALSVTPRDFYARYIDRFGENGGETFGERIDARIRAREAAGIDERRVEVDAVASGKRHGWFGFGFGRTLRSSSLGMDERALGSSEVDERREGERMDGDGVAGRAHGKELTQHEQNLVASLKERLSKINNERDSIIYLVRKIRGEAAADEEFQELTDEEIHDLAARLDVASDESKSVLKKVLGR